MGLSSSAEGDIGSLRAPFEWDGHHPMPFHFESRSEWWQSATLFVVLLQKKTRFDEDCVRKSFEG